MKERILNIDTYNSAQFTKCGDKTLVTEISSLLGRRALPQKFLLMNKRSGNIAMFVRATEYEAKHEFFDGEQFVYEPAEEYVRRYPQLADVKVVLLND